MGTGAQRVSRVPKGMDLPLSGTLDKRDFGDRTGSPPSHLVTGSPVLLDDLKTETMNRNFKS